MNAARAARFAFRFFGVVAVAVVVSLLGAGCWVIHNDGFGRGDLYAMGIWSALFGCVLAPIGFALRRLGRPTLHAGRAFLASVLGLLLGVLWTYTMVWIMGPWFGQMSPPVLWIMASTGGLTLGMIAFPGDGERG